MKQPTAYDNAIDLLDADHKAVKKMFIDYSEMCEDDAPAADKRAVAQRVCNALIVHAQIEEEIFYPQVRKAIGDDVLMDEALKEHAEAKKIIQQIQGMKANDAALDDAVKQLGKLIDMHVQEEREQIFLKASYAALDLRGMVDPLLKRKSQLTKKSTATPVKESA